MNVQEDDNEIIRDCWYCIIWMFHLNCSMAVAVSRMEEGFYLSTAGNVQDFLKSRIWLHTYRFFLKDNTRCGSCIYLTRMNSKIVLSPKIHGKSFENTEMPERMKVQNLIVVVHIQTSRSFFVLRWENIRIPSPSPDYYWCLEQIRECWVTFVMYVYCRSLLIKGMATVASRNGPSKGCE